MLCVPPARVLVVRLALPALSATVPRMALPLRKVTLPVGVPEVCDATAAENFTAPPKVDGFGEASSDVSVPACTPVPVTVTEAAKNVLNGTLKVAACEPTLLGLNCRSTSQLWFGCRKAKLQPSKVTVKLESPLREILLAIKLALPPLVRISASEGLVEKIAWLPKASGLLEYLPKGT